MPRKADEHLEGRIVDAAYRLWSKGGEHALTMRAVARAAETTTPTLYQRFRDKHDLMAFLHDRARQKLFTAIRSARSAAQACRRMLEFMLAHENECRLLSVSWAERMARQEAMPSYQFVQALLEEELRQPPKQQARLAFALVAEVLGTAILLLGEKIDPKMLQESKAACIHTCETLIESARKHRQ